MIIKREKEYRQLREAYEAKENRLIILSGRFGAGKTTLVRQFAQENAGYYYQAAECAPERQKQLLNLCWDRLYDEGRSASEQSAISRIQQTVSRNTYLGIFSEICHRTEGKTLIVMEDFDLIAKNDPDFYRDLVTLMDQEHNLMLLLTVSTWNWREAEAKLEPRSLVGKITDRILLPEFRFLEMVKYFKGLSMVEVVQIYALLGGVPGYLKYWDTGKTIQENVVRLFVREEGILRGEAERYLRSELRELSLYNTVLGSMQEGVVRLNDIHERTGFGRAKISVYMKNLKQLGVVDKCKTFALRCQDHEKKGMYEITDAIVHFWSRFILPYKTVLAVMTPEQFYEQIIAPDLEAYTAVYFERMCVRYLGLMKEYKNSGLLNGRSGAWYGEKGTIPMVMEDREGRILLMYTKWSSEPFTRKDLERNLRYLVNCDVNPDQYYIFAKSGFDAELRQKAQRVKNMHLVDFSNMKFTK